MLTGETAVVEGGSCGVYIDTVGVVVDALLVVPRLERLVTLVLLPLRRARC